MLTNKIEWDNPDFTQEDISVALESLKDHIGAKGSFVSLLEETIQEKIGVKHCIAVDNGTNAILASCIAVSQIFKGKVQKVAVPSFSFVASANAPKFVFDQIDFVDINENDWNIDVESEKLRACDLIIPVDVGGVPCDYDKLNSLNKLIIADSAESLGSTYKGKYIGSQAMIHTFSLHRSKIISSGEGGLITTNNDKIARQLRSIINHGYDLSKESWEYKHDNFGLNFRISNVNAALAYSQLKRLDFYCSHRNELSQLYKEKLKDLEGLKFQSFSDEIVSNYFLFGVLVNPNIRDQIVISMNNKGIVTKTWPSLSTLDCFKQEPLEVSQKIADSIILLPIGNKTSKEEVIEITNTFKELYEAFYLSNN